MATGLDLSGIASLTGLTGGDVSLISVTDNGGSYTATGTVSYAASTSARGIYSSLPMRVTAFSLDSTNQTMDFVVSSSAIGPAVNEHGNYGQKLIGWNSDGLLFESTDGNHYFMFVADPSVPNAIGPDGMPANTTFGTDPNDIPFGLQAITVPCFASGTGIATPEGNVPVEALQAGDKVVTLAGEVKAIKWVGNRRVDCRRHPRPDEIMPVRIKAHAFGEDRPQRDLRVSPGHSIYVDGVLIPAAFLVNGATVVQEQADSMHYYHVELDAHDVLLAEGLAAESYLDDENRHVFSNGGDYAALHPDLDPKSWENACAPRVMAGPQLIEVRQRLIDRADALGYHLSSEPDLHLMADGSRIEPFHTAGLRYWFVAPAGVGELRLNSNSGVPLQVAADHGDSRCLGVAVGEVRVDGVAEPLERVLEANPYALERDGDRCWIWTDGSVALALAPHGESAVVIELTLAMVMQNWSRKPNLSVVRPLAVANAG